MTTPVKGYSAHSPTGRLGLFAFDRRSARADDVVIEILCCGVCHSDVHNVRNDGVNVADERLLEADVKYRFVIDIASLKEEVRP